MSRCSSLLILASLVLAFGCDNDPPGDTDAGPPPGVDAGMSADLLRADCDPLVPEYCAFPFPSDYWLTEDSSTASGSRVAFGPTTIPAPHVGRRLHPDPTPYNVRDGWSVNGSILAYFPNASREGLADPDHIGDSLDMDSPTVLLNTETMERVPHFAELDYSMRCDTDFAECDGNLLNGCEVDLFDPDHCGTCDTVCGAGEVCSAGLCRAECQAGETQVDRSCLSPRRIAQCGGPEFPCDVPPAARALIIRPVVTLQHDTRYIVAIRDLLDAQGAEVVPPATFLALRDGATSEVATIEARRGHFEELFTTLGTAGVGRDDLQLAWDFTTSSLEDDTAWMLSVRDQALEIVGPDGPDFEVESVEEFTPEENEHTVRRIYGQMTVPLFMDQGEEGAVINLGPDGVPAQNGTFQYGIVINVPRNATPDTPVRPLQYGHGLLGDRTQANNRWLAEYGNNNGYIVFGTDWSGMAEEDIATITIALSSGTLQDFRSIAERLIQGIVNALLGMRLMLTGMATHPMFMVDGRSIIDTSAGFYTGDSQGGIFGCTYMAISTDVERGILGVPGMPYNLLLNRSRDFDPYLSLLRNAYSNGPNIQLVQTLIQQLWDRSEPGSFARHIMNDPLPGTPAHQVILQVGLGDHQVTSIAAQLMAREIGAVGIMPQTRPMWGIEEVAGPHMGSAIVEFDYGLPPDPLFNRPQRMGEDPHEAVRRNTRAQAQSLHFFDTGEIIHTCDGPCDPE